VKVSHSCHNERHVQCFALSRCTVFVTKISRLYSFRSLTHRILLGPFSHRCVVFCSQQCRAKNNDVFALVWFTATILRIGFIANFVSARGALVVIIAVMALSAPFALSLVRSHLHALTATFGSWSCRLYLNICAAMAPKKRARISKDGPGHATSVDAMSNIQKALTVR
jgi:hypothetical protein